MIPRWIKWAAVIGMVLIVFSAVVGPLAYDRASDADARAVQFREERIADNERRSRESCEQINAVSGAVGRLIDNQIAAARTAPPAFPPDIVERIGDPAVRELLAYLGTRGSTSTDQLEIDRAAIVLLDCSS
jgi:hypothetical protein